MTTAPPVLELADVKVRRGGVEVLDVPSFRLDAEEIVALIGPNGCGKTTLLLTTMGLIPRSAGRVLFRGAEIASDRAAMECRRRIAMILQEPLLFDTTVYENVAAGLRIRGLARTDVRKRVTACLERFALAPLAQRSARKLSGGEARRVSLARAFAVEPDVVFLDEPFANLDAPTRRAIIDDVERTVRDARMAAILVTHEQAEALRLADRIAVMDRGRIVQSAAPSTVMNDPANEFVASVLGMETIVEGVIARRAGGQIIAAVAGKEIDALAEGEPGDPVYCGIRPENVILQAADPGRKTSARNVFAARVVGVSSAGPYLRVKLDCGFPLVAHVTPESSASLGLAEGAEVFASFKATAIHVIRRGEAPRRRSS
jgi:tungstate transport system ATP-binding protein